MVKRFSVINEADLDVSLECPRFLYYPMYVGSLISGSSAFSKSSLYILKFLVHMLLKPSLKDFEHNLASIWNEHNCMVVWTFFGFALLWDWNENWPFPVLWSLLSFPNLLTYECSTFTASSFRIWNSSAGIPSTPLALFVVMLPKVHLTSHSSMSRSRWVITPLWLSRSLRPFPNSSSVYSCCLFLISSASVRSYCFCPLSCPSLHEIFPWYLQFSWSLIFPILLFSSIYLHCSLKKAFLSLLVFSGILSSVGNIFPFLLCLWLLSFP